MSVQQNQDVTAVEIDDDAVADYLKANPGFFEDRDTLLAQMAVAHTTGATVSLIERQVAILREQNALYKEQLTELVDVARDNDRLMTQMQKLALDLIEADELDAVLTLVQKSLANDFGADAVTLCLFADPTELALEHDRIGNLHILFADVEDDLVQAHRELFEDGEPGCGMIDETQRICLFGDHEKEIRSVAQLPLVKSTDKAILGMLAIGSSDAGRFCAGVGTVFLKYLGALISRKLARYVRGDR